MSKISRREFLENAALLAGGAALATTGLTGCASNAVTTSPSAEESNIKTGKRPNPHGGCPLPMQTGKIGPKAAAIPPIKAPAKWDEEYDVVIVGSGYGGLTAAAYASQAGASVALIEKDGVTGGASRHAAINMIVTGGSKGQEKVGYHWPGDVYDPKAGAAAYQKHCQYTVDNNLLLATIDGGAKWADWMCEQPGVEWKCTGMGYVDVDIFEGRRNTVLGNSKTCDALENNARKAGAKIMLQCECQALVQEGDRITGIKIKHTATGAEYEKFLKAKKAVILTGGGMGYNHDLLEQYVPSAYMYAVQGGPMPTHTGECFRMGIGAGADVSGINSFSCWEGGLDEYWGLGDGNYFHYFWNGAKQVIQNPWLMIDKAGNRLPYYLKSFNKGEVLQPGYDIESYSMGDLASAASWLSSFGHRAYVIFDSNYKSSLEKHEKTVWVLDESRVVLKPDGKTMPNIWVSTDWEGEFLQAVERGAIQKADTLEELAKKLGLDPKKVVAAVDHWNELCKQGKDTDLAVPYLPQWLIPLGKPPYYGAAEGGVISKTMAGLRVNNKMQVMKPDGNCIPGLYAGWYTAGGIGGENNFGGQFGNPTLHGGVAISGVGGYMAIKAVLETEKG